jgi:hypothetical protein
LPCVIELTDLPKCEPNISLARVISGRGTVDVIYELWGERFARVQFSGCSWFSLGGPNDEALRNHPLFSLGLKPYTLQEIVDSPFARERARVQHKDGLVLDRFLRRHFVFALKEDCFECFASSYSLIGTYDDEQSALSRAVP